MEGASPLPLISMPSGNWQPQVASRSYLNPNSPLLRRLKIFLRQISQWINRIEQLLALLTGASLANSQGCGHHPRQSKPGFNGIGILSSQKAFAVI